MANAVPLGLRAEAYRRIAAMFVREPCAREIESFLRFPWREVARIETAEVDGLDFEAIASENRSEFARMFLGPKALVAPPYESSYASLDSRIAVSRFYGEVGLSRDGSIKEPEDFLGFELQCAMHLLNVASLARSADEKEAESEAISYYESFLETHLAKWVHLFSDRVRKGSPSWLIGLTVDVLDAFLADESKRASLR